MMKKKHIKKGQLILAGKKTCIKKKATKGSSQKTQKGGFLPLLFRFASLTLNMLGNMGNIGVNCRRRY